MLDENSYEWKFDLLLAITGSNFVFAMQLFDLLILKLILVL